MPPQWQAAGHLPQQRQAKSKPAAGGRLRNGAWTQQAPTPSPEAPRPIKKGSGLKKEREGRTAEEKKGKNREALPLSPASLFSLSVPIFAPQHACGAVLPPLPHAKGPILSSLAACKGKRGGGSASFTLLSTARPEDAERRPGAQPAATAAGRRLRPSSAARLRHRRRAATPTAIGPFSVAVESRLQTTLTGLEKKARIRPEPGSAKFKKR